MRNYSDSRMPEVEELITSPTDGFSTGEADWRVRQIVALLAEWRRVEISQRIDARRRASRAIKRDRTAGTCNNVAAMATTSSRSAERSEGCR
jgi:hypothetical protein